VPTVTTSDGAEILYKDWGSGPPVVFSHGWPLNADSWEAQMLFLAERGHRCIAQRVRVHRGVLGDGLPRGSREDAFLR
jgi:non-heme chloroperoxidase